MLVYQLIALRSLQQIVSAVFTFASFTTYCWDDISVAFKTDGITRKMCDDTYIIVGGVSVYNMFAKGE